MAISLLKTILGPWEQARGNLLKDLQRIQEFLNKLPDPPTVILPRSTFIVTGAYPSIDTDSFDFFAILRLDTDIASFSMNLKGTPVEGQQLVIRIQDDGTPRNIVWGPKFADANNILPSGTSGASTYSYNLFIYNDITKTWDCVI